MLLSQYRVYHLVPAISGTFWRASCGGHSRITWVAVWLIMQRSQIDVGVCSHFCMDDWNCIQVGLDRSMPNGLTLGLGTKKRSFD